MAQSSTKNQLQDDYHLLIPVINLFHGIDHNCIDTIISLGFGMDKIIAECIKQVIECRECELNLQQLSERVCLKSLRAVFIDAPFQYLAGFELCASNYLKLIYNFYCQLSLPILNIFKDRIKLYVSAIDVYIRKLELLPDSISVKFTVDFIPF